MVECMKYPVKYKFLCGIFDNDLIYCGFGPAGYVICRMPDLGTDLVVEHLYPLNLPYCTHDGRDLAIPASGQFF